MRNHHTLLLLALALVGCATATGAANGYTAACTDYDLNGDALVDGGEFGAGLYDDWDTNDNAVLTSPEWSVGVRTDDAFGTWNDYADAWDTDGDGYLHEDEFIAGFEDAGVFDTWDADRSGDLDLSECDDVF